MADAFISYSRRDREFVRQLHDALAARGRDTWVDWQDIPLTSEWWQEIVEGIEAADTFVFVISPDSVVSTVCQQELDHAIRSGKRIIPVVRREVSPSDPLPSGIERFVWIFFREEDDFETGFKQLLEAIDTDLDHVRAHTRLLVRAREWETRSQESSLLLRGEDLFLAEGWLASSTTKIPEPTDLHAAYIKESRLAENRRQRTVVSSVAVGLVMILILGIIVVVQSIGSIDVGSDRVAPNTSNAIVGITVVVLMLASSNFFTFYVMRRRWPTVAPPTSVRARMPPLTPIKLSVHTFLSYSRQDQSYLDRVRDGLSDQDIPTWTDEELQPGTRQWEREIEKAIREAGCFVVLLSPYAVESPWVQREISFAETVGITIVPVLIHGDPTEIVPIRLINHQYINLIDQKHYESGFRDLSVAIINHLTVQEMRERLTSA